MKVIADSYALSNTTYHLNSAGPKGAYQSFSTVAGVLDSVVFNLLKTLAPTGNIVAKLYAHTGSLGTTSAPTGAALATSDVIDVATLGSNKPVTFVFSGSNRISLSATNYVVSCEFSGGDASNWIGIRTDTTTAAHAGNAGSSNDLAAWTPAATFDLMFIVYLADKSFAHNTHNHRKHPHC
jgi:hypothetical protein